MRDAYPIRGREEVLRVGSGSISVETNPPHSLHPPSVICMELDPAPVLQCHAVPSHHPPIDNGGSD
jgi:hypothetical protein